MRLLYLIRHAAPDIQPNVPTPAWRLSQRGIDDARRLADIARPWRLQSIYSSVEPKAEARSAVGGPCPRRVGQGQAQEIQGRFVIPDVEGSKRQRAPVPEGDAHPVWVRRRG